MAAIASRAWILWGQVSGTPSETPGAAEPLDLDLLQDSLCIVGTRHRVEAALDGLGWPTDLRFHRMIDRLLEQEELNTQDFESVGQIMRRCRLPHLHVLQGGRK